MKELFKASVIRSLSSDLGDDMKYGSRFSNNLSIRSIESSSIQLEVTMGELWMTEF